MFNWIKKLFSAKSPELPSPAEDQVLPGKLQITHFEAGADDQVRIEVEYNDEFVGALRGKGFTGTDEQVVSAYISQIYKSVEMQGNKYD